MAPAVYVTTSPAELIQSKGRPQFSPIPNTQLTYVTNSENDIFMYLPTQAYYTVLSGRWFAAKVLRGQWNPVADGELPQDFAKIPADSPKASVLASVPDTKQARQAVITSQIPETAAVTRKDAKLSVRYDGEPQFKPVEGTSLEYAVNTSTDVIHAEGKYYACHDAVWFVSADARRALGGCRLHPGRDLSHSGEFSAVPRALRAGVQRHARFCVLRLHTGLHGSVRVARRSGLWHRLGLSRVVWALLLWLALDVGARLPLRILGRRVVLASGGMGGRVVRPSRVGSAGLVWRRLLGARLGRSRLGRRSRLGGTCTTAGGAGAW